MGSAEGCSMLYLEARCLAAIRAAGSQGCRNGSISCVALVLRVPGGARAILAENVLAAWLDSRSLLGNDAIASTPIRRTAKLMGQFLPGTDFVTSGYSVMPRYDNMFGGGNYDSADLDEWLTCSGTGRWTRARAVRRGGRRRGARRAALAVQAVFAGLGFPAVTDEEVRRRPSMPGQRDLPVRDRAADVPPRRVFAEGIDGLDVARELDRPGFRRRRRGCSRCSGRRSPPTTSRPRRSSTAIGHGRLGRERPEPLRGPGTGHRLEGERWQQLQSLPYEWIRSIW
jgi:propanediol dehydratase large subunit